MGDAPEIRTAKREDSATVQRLLEALATSIGKPGGIAGSEADLDRFGFGDAPRFTAFIARLGGEDVGLLLGFVEYSSWRGRPGLYVQDLFVEEAAREFGIGRALLAEAARRIADAGGAYLRLSADADNQDARRFYASAGFRHAEEECMYLLDGAAFEAASDSRSGSSE